MTTRFSARPASSFGVAPNPTGFGSPASFPDAGTVTVPPVGIEDVDVALFNLFDKEIPLQVTAQSSDGGITKVPVIFAAGEKWAVLKNGRALRDKNNSLILPLITIMRTSVAQGAAEDVSGRGMNQQTGEIVVRRRLNSTDRTYQNLINRLFLKNQPSLAVRGQDDPISGQIVVSGSIGDLQFDPVIQDGGLLIGDLLDNVWETIVLPAPQFFTAVCDVTVWTQYTTHMNQVLECIMSSQLPQGNAWQLTTKKGYWFVATVEGNTYTPENNFDDMSNSERIIKYKFVVKVPGYVLASDTPGAPVPVRRHVSAPSIDFTLATTVETQGVEEPFLGSDDPTLPSEVGKSGRRDQRRDGKTKLYPKKGTNVDTDPALLAVPRGQPLSRFRKVTGKDKKGRDVVRYVRLKNVNSFTGEVVYAPDASLDGVTITAVDD